MSNRRVALILKHGDCCHICGLRMHFFLKGPGDGCHVDPLAMTGDHLKPLSTGVRKPNRLRNLRLAHYLCNTMRGASGIDDELRKQCRAAIQKILEARGF